MDSTQSAAIQPCSTEREVRVGTCDCRRGKKRIFKVSTLHH